MEDGYTNEQLRAISPFLVKDYNVLVLADGNVKNGTLTLSTQEYDDFAKNATDWEESNSPILTGSNRWTPVIDGDETVLAYSSIESNTGVYHLIIRDINGGLLLDRVIGEKPLESDPLGDALAATVITLGAGLILRGIAAGIANGAAAALVGSRILSLAISRVVAGETTEGVVFTALRSIRAQAIVKALQARNIFVVVNVGGEAGSQEIAKWGLDQIALNHQVRMGIAKRFIPNLVKENGENIGEVFSGNTIDKIVSRRLDANFNVEKFARGAFRVLKGGGQIEMELFSNNPTFGATFRTALQRAGFKNVTSEFNVRFTAVK